MIKERVSCCSWLGGCNSEVYGRYEFKRTEISRTSELKRKAGLSDGMAEFIYSIFVCPKHLAEIMTQDPYSFFVNCEQRRIHPISGR